MILFPNAKINLGLDIVGKRNDGYHNLETVMYPIPWYDILEIVPSSGCETTLTVTGRTVGCPPEKNLVMKAVKALSEKVEIPPVDIYLRKIIPDGAGLGGGSADAAFTLKGLNDIFSLDFSDETLAEVAAGLGADCPFFIYNRPMLCTDIGTVFEPIDVDLDGLTLVVAKPQVSVPTAEAYSRVTPMPPSLHIKEIISGPVTGWRGLLKNDFEQSILPAYPEIRNIKNLFEEAGAIYVSMSGSGSAVYALFDSDILSDRLTASLSDCDILIKSLHS